MAKRAKITNVTEEIIKQWKQEYGEVWCIEVAEEPESSDDNTVSSDLDKVPTIKGYLKKPDRKVMNYAMVTMPRNIIAAGKTVMKDCWLGGDERLLDDETYSATASFQAVELVDIYQSRLKKV